MSDEFANVRILDNFYQTSSYFPMPVVLVSTLADTGQTNLGPYSLCFPFIVAGHHAMLLIARGTSNTAQNILRTGICAINFIPDKRKYLKNCVMLGYPGETTAEKMKSSIFTLLPSMRSDEQRASDVAYPAVVKEAVQVFECTWDRSYASLFSEQDIEYRFVLHVDAILMKRRWYDGLIKGRGFPRLPIDYGYRNNTRFWFTRGPRPYPIGIPRSKGVSVNTVQYAADRYDPSVKWQEAACAKLVRVPRVFLGTVIGQCVEAAKQQGVNEITPEFLDAVRDKRKQEQG